MSCNPSDFLDLAKELGGEADCSEIRLRSATSRGYYAALHSVDDVVPTVEGVQRQRGEGSHAFVIRRAIKYGDGPNPGRRVAKEIALALKKLKDQRNSADYELKADYNQRMTSDALVRVAAILDDCDTLRAAIASQAAKIALEEVVVEEKLCQRPALKRIR